MNITLRTELHPMRSQFDITHNDRLMCIGSCFAENIGALLQNNKFKTNINPKGIVYNPHSIAACIKDVINNELINENSLLQHQGIYQHLDWHSRFAHRNKEEALRKMQDSLNLSHQFIQKTNRLLLTLGTANVFVWRETGKIVANCHKLTASTFEPLQMSVATVEECLNEAFQTLKKINPDIQIILTVSPVRHIRDGIIENQRSKSTLILACTALAEALPYVHYFPAYELMIDDLRDYRFYEQDMIHPNALAIEYIWQFFQKTYFNDDTILLLKLIKSIQQSANHRPFHFDTSEHQLFIQKTLAIMDKTEKINPNLDFSTERKLLITKK